MPVSRLECVTVRVARICRSNSFFSFFTKCSLACNNLDSLTLSVNAERNTVAEFDSIKYTCNVTFASSGEITPSIRWTLGGDEISASVTSSANRQESVCTVTAGTSNLPSVKCEVFFPDKAVSAPSAVVTDDVAQNTPNYMYTNYTDSHSFEEIRVTCKLFS